MTEADQDSAQPPLRILREVFGYPDFRGQQAEIVAHVRSGESALVLMPTGSGKSLCYQVPALCREGVGVVVSPLIALMNDQVAALRQLGVKAAAIHSGLEPAQFRKNWAALKGGELDLLYVAPERLMTDGFLELLDVLPVALFAVDEAHCISQWGHDFRPEYRQLSQLRRRFPDVPMIAVTATADGATRRDIEEKLALPRTFAAGFDRPNIRYQVALKENPRLQLLDFLRSRAQGESGIVYCLSRKRVEETAEWLNRQGFTALPYHAGLDASVREANQMRFLREDNVVMVATIAFGMGINKPDVRFVAHMDLPKNIEAYYQETGRAGRDGQPAVAWMVYGLADVVMLRGMIDGGDSPDAQKRVERGKLDRFLSFCEAARCRRQMLLEYFGDGCAPCGNCDTCTNPPETFDATVPAQKALSAVYRTGERFGANYLVDVLLGRDPDGRAGKFGHDTLSVFGIGAELGEAEWRSVIRQLVVHDLIFADADAHNGIKLTDRGAAFLKSRETIRLRRDEKAARRQGRRGAVRPKAADVAEDGSVDPELFARLKAERLAIAREQGVPPYVIFHDRVLIEMARRDAHSLERMAGISGVGQIKLERYGQRFADVIAAGA
jgi:ATP-dependent DNA helicase RecQ